MIYMLDSANIEEIKKSFDLFPMAGVTTNPSIVTKENRDYHELLSEIRGIIGKEKMLHTQVISETFSEIVEESNFITTNFGETTYTKIPVTAEGLKAIRYLKNKFNRNITATAIFSAQQALIAAEAGADYVAPYVNRSENIGIDSTVTISEISRLFAVGQIANCRILGASFKNVKQVNETVLAGAESITVSYETLTQLIYHPLTDSSIRGFIHDWEKTYNTRKLYDKPIA